MKLLMYGTGKGYGIKIKSRIGSDALIDTCVRGITHSVSARRWEGDGFDTLPKSHHS